MAKTLTLIGSGKMASALALGLENNFTLEIVGRDERKLKEFAEKLQKTPKITTLDKLKSINGKTLIFCVKPYAVDSILLKGEAEAIISVMAGVSIDRLKEKYSAKSYLRAMPNIAASFQKSATAICGDESLKELGSEIFLKIGSVVWLATQKELNIATALGGSGPAFLALVAEALIDAGVKEGLKREDAKELAIGLFDGFAELLKSQNPNQIKESVMSPGGTTAEGIAVLEGVGIRGAFFDAIKEATKRANELSVT